MRKFINSVCLLLVCLLFVCCLIDGVRQTSFLLLLHIENIFRVTLVTRTKGFFKIRWTNDTSSNSSFVAPGKFGLTLMLQMNLTVS